VALIRRRKSVSFSSGAWKENGRIAAPSLVSSAAAVGPADMRLMAPAAAEAARTLRRDGVDGFLDMIISVGCA
jgi:hypothetical protein